MKAQFLKIAKCKDEKSFYKKYPTQEAFFKAHPEAKKSIKKAQAGLNVDKNNNSIPDYLENLNPNVGMFQSGTQQSVGGPTYSPGNYNSWDIDNNGVPDTIQQPQGNPLVESKPDYNQMYMSMSTADEQLKQPQGQQPNTDSIMKGGMNVIGGMFNAANAMKAQKEALKNARMWADVSGVVKRAAISNQFAEKPKNTWIRHDDQNQIANINQMYSGQGVGTNALARNGARLEDGGMVGGNPTEIQNTYGDGNSLFDDLGYVPLIDENQQKSFYHGGNVPRAQFGIASAGMEGFGENPYSSLTGSMFNNSGGSQMGSAVGSMFGPFGGLTGGMIGGMLDKTGGKTKDAQQRFQRNMDYVAGIDSTAGIHNQFNSVMEDGGWVSNDWNPQVITMFGDVDDQDFADFAHKDEFRAGGHLKAYREPSERAMQTYAMGGELKTHWGGYAEPMSENPYLPGSGETVMFRGKSHDESDGKGNTGIGITFGNSPVEVERGEPAVKLKDGGTGEDNLTVYGNLMIPDYGVEILGDKKAKGRKFKNYIADISKTEAKQNKLIDKSTNELDELDLKTPFDKLKLSSLQANILGGNMKLKDVADKKIKAADIQNAINDTAEEYSLVADDLAKGKIKIDKKAMNMREAMFGTKLTKAQDGVTESAKASTFDPKKAEEIKELYRQAKAKGIKSKEALALQKKFHEYFPDVAKEIILDNPEITGKARKMGYKNIADLSKADRNIILNTNVDEYMGPRTEQYMAALARLERPRSADLTAPTVTSDKKDEPDKQENKFEIIKNKKNPWLNIGYQTLKGFLDRPYEEALSPDQLMGEYYALSSNQVEPVQATPYSPQLRVPYDISLQDQINQITSDQRATQKMMGYNPAAQAMVASQAYDAKSKVLADQFRANQAMKDQVYSGNIATLNDAQLKNLAIYDQQYTRQEQAKSNTKAIAQAALSSIGDKLAKHKADVREYNVYKTLFPQYGFDRSGRGRFEGGYADFNTPQSQYPFYNNPNYALVKNSDGTFTYKLKEQVTEDDQVMENPKTPSMATNPINGNNVVYEDDQYEYIASPIQEREEMLPSKKTGGKIRKSYSQSSIVKAFK